MMPPPTSTPPLFLTIAENQSIGSTVEIFTASDADANPITYQLVSGVGIVIILFLPWNPTVASSVPRSLITNPILRPIPSGYR